MVKTVNLVMLITKSCEQFGITLDDFKSKEKYSELVCMRSSVSFFLHERLNISFGQISRLMNRDRSTIYHQLKIVNNARFIMDRSKNKELKPLVIMMLETVEAKYNELMSIDYSNTK